MVAAPVSKSNVMKFFVAVLSVALAMGWSGANADDPDRWNRIEQELMSSEAGPPKEEALELYALAFASRGDVAGLTATWRRLTTLQGREWCVRDALRRLLAAGRVAGALEFLSEISREVEDASPRLAIRTEDLDVMLRDALIDSGLHNLVQSADDHPAMYFASQGDVANALRRATSSDESSIVMTFAATGHGAQGVEFAAHTDDKPFLLAEAVMFCLS